MARKKATLDDVVNLVEDLARMTQAGFLEVQEQAERNKQELRAQMQTDREQNHKEHADIRFKASETVTRVEHNQLQVRVDRLETTAA